MGFFLANASPADSLWEIARAQTNTHRFSTLFSAQDVRRHLSDSEGMRKALDWCRRTAVTKVYIESFRDNYQAERTALEEARKTFAEAGFVVAGCVTTTQVGKKSTGWSVISCYTDAASQERIRAIFEFTADLFDEIMIDDFWFTDCRCPECDAARQTGRVTIGKRTYPVPGPSWDEYHAELMVRLSQDYVLAAAKRVNPKVRLIIKYPQWYDGFHERGYDVLRETADFDRIWVGTETRDYGDARWGGTVQYEGYFIMRWLGGIGQEKCGGGWYDWLGTTERTYVEQARQTVLGGARESLLFCYGGLQGSTGPRNVETLRGHIPELLKVSGEVQRREVVGLAAYKPPGSPPGREARVFDFVGMLGVPLVPCHEFPQDAPGAFFSVHALKDPDFAARLKRYLALGRPVLMTDGLLAKLQDEVKAGDPNLHVLPVQGDPKSLLQMPQSQLDALREPLLKPFQVAFRAPNQVALYLFKDGSWVVENFNDEPVQVELNQEPRRVPDRGWTYRWQEKN